MKTPTRRIYCYTYQAAAEEKHQICSEEAWQAMKIIVVKVIIIRVKAAKDLER